MTCKFGDSKLVGICSTELFDTAVNSEKSYLIGTAVDLSLCCVFILLKSEGLKQGLEPYRKEPVLEPKFFKYWEPKPHRNPNLN